MTVDEATRPLSDSGACDSGVRPALAGDDAARLARVAKALSDPIRLQLVDLLRKNEDRVCPCELLPMFEISQPTLSHHFKVLREAGIVDSQRRGLRSYYFVRPDALGELEGWLASTRTGPAGHGGTP